MSNGTRSGTLFGPFEGKLLLRFFGRAPTEGMTILLKLAKLYGNERTLTVFADIWRKSIKFNFFDFTQTAKFEKSSVSSLLHFVERDGK